MIDFPNQLLQLKSSIALALLSIFQAVIIHPVESSVLNT